MPEKEEIKEVYEQLNEDNKEILNMVAQGMVIAQNQNHIPRID